MRERPCFTVNLCRAAALCPRLFWFGWHGGATLLCEPEKTPTMGRAFHEAMDGLFAMFHEYEKSNDQLPDEKTSLSLAYDKVLAPILERRLGADDQGEMLSGLWASFQQGVLMVNKYLRLASNHIEAERVKASQGGASQGVPSQIVPSQGGALQGMPSQVMPSQVVESTLLQGEHEVQAATRRTGGASLSGRIDAIIFDHSRQLPLILEYKTGARKWRQADVVQVSLYRWMLKEARGVEAEPVICYFTPELEEMFFDEQELHEPPFVEPTAILHDMENWIEWEEGQEPLPPPCGPDLCFKCPHQKTCAEIFGPIEGGPQ